MRDIVMVGSKTFISGAANVNIDLFFSGLPRLPEEGQELYSKGFSLQMGGGLPATLINLGRLGIPVRIQGWERICSLVLHGMPLSPPV